jgi:hypothetical protein
MPGNDPGLDTTERRRLHERIDEALKSMGGIMAEVSSLTTLVRATLAEQKNMNRKLDQEREDHERRLRLLEEWRAGVDRIMPARIADASDVEERLDEQDAQLRAIDRTLAKWAGVAIVGLILIEVVVVPLVKTGWSVLFGG